MTKTIKHKNKNKNKTIKHKVSLLKKREFIKAILKEWIKQTNGFYEKDIITHYKNDYYLSFNKNGDFYNHIHLILNNLNDIKYVMKKMDINDKKVIHSKGIKMNTFSDPVKVVRNMIKNYNHFKKEL